MGVLPTRPHRGIRRGGGSASSRRQRLADALRCGGSVLSVSEVLLAALRDAHSPLAPFLGRFFGEFFEVAVGAHTTTSRTPLASGAPASLRPVGLPFPDAEAPGAAGHLSRFRRTQVSRCAVSEIVGVCHWPAVGGLSPRCSADGDSRRFTVAHLEWVVLSGEGVRSLGRAGALVVLAKARQQPCARMGVSC